MINPNFYNRSKLIASEDIPTDHFPIRDRVNGVEVYPYTLGPGETIYTIAEKLFEVGTSQWTVITDLNPPRHPDLWKEGDIIMLPKVVTQENYPSLRNAPTYSDKPTFERTGKSLNIISNPVCPIVTNIDSVVSGQIITFSWDSANGQAYFIFQIKPDSVEDWDGVPEQQVYSNSIQVSGLIADTTYNARVKAVCSFGGDSAYVYEDATTGQPSVCNTPTGLLLPDVGQDFAVVSWSDTGFTSTTMYVVSYKKLSDSVYSDAYITGATEILLSGLTPNTAYTAYVRKRCSATSFSTPSAPIAWTTTIQCGIPFNTSIVAVTDDAVTFHAEGGVGAVSVYAEIHSVNTDGTIGPIVSTTSYSPPIDEHTFAGLDSGSRYRIIVRTICAGSVQSGDVVLPDVFTSGSNLCPVPSINTVQDYWIEETPSNWKRYLEVKIFGSVGAFQYKYFVESVLKDTTPLLTALIDITAAGYVMGQSILIQVRADCSGNVSSGLSSKTHILSTQAVSPPSQYVCPIPIVAVLSETINGSIKVHITETSSDDVRYIIEWKKDTDFVWNSSGEVNPSQYGYDYDIVELETGNVYDIRGTWICHDTENDQDIQSSPAQISYFYNPSGGGEGTCAPPPFVQINNVTSSGATVSWEVPDPPGSAVGYRLQVIRVSTQLVVIDIGPDVLNADAYTYNVTGLDNLTNYIVRMQSECAAGGFSPFTEGLPFTTNDTGGSGGGGGTGTPGDDPTEPNITVYAGPNKVLDSGETTTTVTAEISIPEGSDLEVVTQIWSVDDAPNIPDLTDPSNLTTGVTGLEDGVTTLRFTVTDNLGRSFSDTMTITVGGGMPPTITVNAGPDQTLSGTTETTLTATLTIPDGVTVVSQVWTEEV